MDIRKQKEKEYHNLKRDGILKTSEYSDYISSQRKWYSIVRASKNCREEWLKINCKGKKVLDYGCGNGEVSIKILGMGAAEVAGIDISEKSIELARIEAGKKGLDNLATFLEMDAENMRFESNSFDIVHITGVLHHLDLKRAYSEIARVLKPDGQAICAEPLIHNLLIQFYRKKTLHLRTKWEAEHILHKKDIELASHYFQNIKILGFFHLFSIAAVPFRYLPIFPFILSILEIFDRILLKLPILKWQAWQIVFALSMPQKK